jgi:hydroxymethylbilane synthase
MTPASTVRLGTRGSQLALYQAHTVQQLLAQRGGPHCEIVVIKTSGDRLQEAPLSEVGGKRLFVKEIEDALLQGAIDLAVHSSKDMPSVLPEGLDIAGVLPRDDPRDALVLPAGGAPGSGIGTVDELVRVLGPAPVIATSSIRRVAQLRPLFPSATFTPIRGNLDTRLRKLDGGAADALVLAAAGLRRLGFHGRISFTLPVETCVPAPGQGIIAIEMRSGDDTIRECLQSITDPDASSALAAERSLVEALGGGCQTPVGALATVHGDGSLDLIAVVAALDRSRAVRASRRGPADAARSIGHAVAARLRADGADAILDEARMRQHAPAGSRLTDD